MNKFDKLREDLANAVDSSIAPILCWSGGKDSSLLLKVLTMMGYEIPLLSFPYFWSKKQKQHIIEVLKEVKLPVFFYSPVGITYKNGVAKAIYKIGDVKVTFVMDQLFNEENCGVEIGRSAMKDSYLQPSYLWDKTIVGGKRVDSHQAMPSPSLLENNEKHTFVTPLWEWTDEEVMKCCRELEVNLNEKFYTYGDEETDTGNFVACMNCIGVESAYCPKVNLQIEGVSL